jgi:hypothetical protein
VAAEPEPEAAEPSAASPTKKKAATKKEASADEQKCAHPGCENKFKDKRAKFCPEHRKAETKAAVPPPEPPVPAAPTENDTSAEETPLDHQFPTDGSIPDFLRRADNLSGEVQ